jgi:hypothetical protein
VQVQYQWLLNGKPIRAASRASYAPRRWMHDRWLRVQITASKVGYRDWISTSPPVRIR